MHQADFVLLARGVEDELLDVRRCCFEVPLPGLAEGLLVEVGYGIEWAHTDPSDSVAQERSTEESTQTVESPYGLGRERS